MNRPYMKGTALSKAREAAGLTLRQVTAATGVPHARLSEYERGLSEPLVSTAIRIARFYGQSVEELFKDFLSR
jgi:transcriptional regulator with XRE-family HTH domain